MPAILTTTSHGTVSSLSTAYNALKTGRTNAGFGTTASGANQLIYDDATTTSYNQIYKFSNGTGTFADTYIKFYNSSTTQIYQQGQAPSLTSGNPNGGLVSAGAAVGAETGYQTSAFGIFSNNTYRSLSFKPSTGSDYGVHVYQQFDVANSEWRTVLAEAFFKASNKPASFNENLASSTVFMFAYGRAVLWGGALNAVNAYDRWSWRYTDQPYTSWAGNPANSINTTSGGRSPVAMLCRSAFPSSYGLYGGLNILGEVALSTGGAGLTPYTTTGSELYKAVAHNQNYDWMTHLCEPVRLGVANLDSNGRARLAAPFILRNRGLDVGIANTSDVFIGPEFTPGTILQVSANEVYTSAFGHIYLRTT